VVHVPAGGATLSTLTAVRAASVPPGCSYLGGAEVTITHIAS